MLARHREDIALADWLIGPQLYVLDGHTPVRTADTVAWGEAMQRADIRRVAAAHWDEPPLRVSTVFLGVDHRHHPGGRPILFESMVFDDDAQDAYGLDGSMQRYCDWDTALAGHRGIVAELVGIFGPPAHTMEAP